MRLQEEAERRERLKCMQASLEEQQSSNAQRRQQLAEVQARVAALKVGSCLSCLLVHLLAGFLAPAVKPRHWSMHHRF